MLRGAVFDLDGTLLDSMRIWHSAGEVYLRSIGKEPGGELSRTFHTMSLSQSAAYIHENYAPELSAAEIMSGINRTVEDFYFHSAQPKPGVLGFLRELRDKGVKMCVATATDRYQVEAAMKRCGLDKYFSAIFTCGEVGHGKDEPVIFQKALEHLNTSRADTAVFEDAYHAAATAKADGFVTVGVFDRHEERQTELRGLADCFIESFLNTDNFWKFVRGI